MSEEGNAELEERRSLIRQVRQRLESLGRAGLVQIPRPATRKPPEVEGLSRDRARRARTGLSVDEAAVATRPVARGPEPEPNPSAPAAPLITSPVDGSQPPAAPPPRAAAAGPPPAMASLFGESGFDTPPVPAAARPAILAAAAAEVAACTRCPHLAATRTQTVFGAGAPTARLMFIGEAPGADEDRLGQPFVGRAGQLLTDMITKGMGLRREEVYIANVLKCRPPENRTPTPEEVANCSSYLEHQIALIRPEFLCLLGRTAAAALLDVPPATTMGQLRRRWHRYRGIKTLVTYHPSYLLRTPTAKKEAWEDLKVLMTEMGLPLPGRSRRAAEG